MFSFYRSFVSLIYKLTYSSPLSPYCRDLSINAYTNLTHIQVLIFALYRYRNQCLMLSRGSPSAYSHVVVLATNSEAMAMGIPSNRTNSTAGKKRRSLQEDISIYHSRSLTSIFPDSQVYALLKPLAEAIHESNIQMNDEVLTVRLIERQSQDCVSRLFILSQEIPPSSQPTSICIANSDPALTYTTPVGALVGSDTLTGTLTRVTGDTVGEYTINQGTVTNTNNTSSRP